MPRLPLPLLNLALRGVVKPRLARETSALAMRRRLETTARIAFRAPPGAVFEEDRLAAGGREVPALRGRVGAPAAGRVVLYLHGGAFLAGSPRTHRHLATRLAAAAGAEAVIPDYRLAPEHAFPAAVEDAHAAYAALLSRGHPARGIALAGDSAGGGLAAAVLLTAAAAGLPRPAALVAFSPWADMTGRGASYRANARADAMLPAERLADVAEMVLQGADAADPRASPALGRFADPPPALIFASRTEIVRDDAIALAEALRRAGGEATLRIEPRLPHAWPIFAGLLAAADRTVRDAGAFLSRALGA